MPFPFSTYFPFHQHTPTLWIKSIKLFIAPSHDRRHIVPYLLGLVACSSCIIASYWVEAAVQSLWMNWVSARGWEMALIPLWCHSRDKELYETSHSFVCLFLSLSVPTPGSLVLWWVHITVWWLIPQLSHPSPSYDPPLLSSLARPGPAPPFLQTWALATKIPISRPRSGAQAKNTANLVHMCVYVCVYLVVV